MDQQHLLSIALVDDHPPILRAVIGELSASLPIKDAVTARTVEELLSDASATSGSSAHFDLVILDLQLGDDSDPAENVRRITELGWPVLIYTQGGNSRLIARCFSAGASGIVGKNQELCDLVEAASLIISGQPYLSDEWAAAVVSDLQSIPEIPPREAEALRLYASGLPMKSVARRMDVSPETVKAHLKQVKRRYEEVGRPAATKTELYFRAIEDGWISPHLSPP